MIIKKKLKEILRKFYDSEPKDFDLNIENAANDIIKLFIDSINNMEFKRDSQLCG